MSAYYNEFDPYAAQWLRNLILEGHLPRGDVDERSITDVRADDLRGYTQCHFFAGIGGWPHALRLAGWSDERPVWTGSCPCQPFSEAGKRKGKEDERHLWPDFYRLIRERSPSTVFGEQIAAKDGLEWLSGVRADLEASGYAVGCADLCAASVGAPHRRQRLWFVANAASAGSLSASLGSIHSGEESAGPRDGEFERRGYDCGLGNPNGEGYEIGTRFGGNDGSPDKSTEWKATVETGLGRMGDASCEQVGFSGQPWRQSDTVNCADGKARRIEPGTFPLAYGVQNRVGKLRAYGNAIVPQVAQAFIEAFMECQP